MLGSGVIGANGAEPGGSDRSMFYLSVAGGLSVRESGADEPAEVSFDTGMGVAGAVGVRLEGAEAAWMRGLRFQVEYGWQFHDLDHLDVRVSREGPLSGNAEPARGNVDIETIQGAVYYDFPLSRWCSGGSDGWYSPLTPYVGIGLGAGRVHVEGLGTPMLDTISGLYLGNPNFNMVSTSEFQFCWSPRLGVSWALSDHWDVFAEGMYLQSRRLAVVDPFGSVNHPSVKTWSGYAGIRYTF